MTPSKHIVCIITLISLFFTGSLSSQTLLNQFQELNQYKIKRIQSKSVISAKLHILLGQEEVNKKQKISAIASNIELALQSEKNAYIFDQRGRPGLTIQANNIKILIPALEKLGFTLTAMSEMHNLIEGFLSYDRILMLDNLKSKGLLYVDIIYRPVLNTGSVTSQGDQVMGVEKARMLAPGIDGTGVKIGVLSNSYDCLGGAAAGVLSNDLPVVTSLDDSACPENDEGRAIIELIYDLAPGAEQYFATAYGGEAYFANNIQALANAGCKIIVDDITYFSEPFFQNGVIAQKVNEVSNLNGVIYFASAGNFGDQSYESTDINIISPSVWGVGIGDYDFDHGAGVDRFNRITLNPGETIRLMLQWDKPFYTIGGVDTDIDFFLMDDPPTGYVAKSNANNLISNKPSEFIQFTNPNAVPTSYNIYLLHSSGAAPGRIKIVNFTKPKMPEYDTHSSTVVGHAAAEKAIAIAAIPFYSSIPESFTSHGPTTILFEDNGTLKGSPEVRQTPDFSATDGTNNTFYGYDISEDPDDFPNFFGTSAAVPHAAGLAALICQANNTLSRDDIYNLLLYGAKDLGSPGFDNITGFGLINALSSCVVQDIIAGNDLLGVDATTYKLRAKNMITANGTILESKSFQFLAGLGITLDPLFEVKILGELLVEIKNCDDP